jgi:S-adenosylmethionine:tRNA ribosyltransferase-isomerase
LRTSDFDYDLPQRYIAQTPLQARDQSRLLVLNRSTGSITHTIFNHLGDLLNTGDILVLNETRVIPGRLFANKLPSGGRVEILLLKKRNERTWEALVGGKGVVKGKLLQIEAFKPGDKTPMAKIIDVLPGAERLIHFDEPVEDYLPSIGHVPLPPYIHAHLDDPERYQTVYAKHEGSAAAPTAGLHFTSQLISDLEKSGISIATVTLHVGLDTFSPVNETNPKDHHIHSEWCQVNRETSRLINQKRAEGGRVVAVGTTSVRTLESAVVDGELRPFEGPTNLFILPGYRFKLVDAMITNFHLPRSTLIMLVSAFAGREQIMRAYEVAKAENYRFYSFGDAMLIL